VNCSGGLAVQKISGEVMELFFAVTLLMGENKLDHFYRLTY